MIVNTKKIKRSVYSGMRYRVALERIFNERLIDNEHQSEFLRMIS